MEYEERIKQLEDVLQRLVDAIEDSLNVEGEMEGSIWYPPIHKTWHEANRILKDE